MGIKAACGDVELQPSQTHTKGKERTGSSNLGEERRKTGALGREWLKCRAHIQGRTGLQNTARTTQKKKERNSATILFYATAGIVAYMHIDQQTPSNF